ncbi:MAG: hypothetical protein J4224_00240 [Candidatus Diapherotrites archaeon]|uniref:Uncharacterized protein n=1 Tax=Candidatus Iainarchaeum sp. TaxID=3101447 RepID=A0A7J4IQX6_9ARCH|nr:MAG: hypothetical protein QT03_C0001G1075 [archaeon GW2011_AR10]MBS3058838.1 hypothetical protein [Candidatus Diapherotrites archaeon]HIH07901.1 hypothetical protein [Candidatus Diapherotrites archaeon]
MVFKAIIAKIKSFFGTSAVKQELGTIYHREDVVEEVHSLWDYLKFREHSQAYHITSVVGFEEWVPMDEILRRIREIFKVEYKNERSLYPYIKTLVDTNLLEAANFGGKMRWRKKDLIIKIEKLPEQTKETVAAREKKKQTPNTST